MSPAVLDHAGIAALIPHRGPMCLLDRMISWSASTIECTAVNHREPRHPLRSASGLLASATIEYAAQAMALHGALLQASGPACGGYLVSVRDVRCSVAALDTAGTPLEVEAERLMGGGANVIYAFRLHAAGVELLSGRATVVLT